MNVNFDGNLFAAQQLLDKTLIARQPVPVYSNPYTLNQIATVQTGNPIGSIYSYVGGSPGESLFWMFLRNDGTAYYVEHFSNRFDVSTLQQQGVLTIEQQLEQQAQEDAQLFPGFDFPSIPLDKIALFGGLIIGGLILYNLTKK